MSKLILDQKKKPNSNLFNQKKMTDAEAKAKMEQWSKALKGKPVKLKSSDTKKSLEKEAKQSKISTINVPSNKQNASASQNAKDCPHFCRKPGFTILPVRYAVATNSLKVLPSNLGENVTNIKLSKHKYIAEMITEGYIYLYFKRAGIDEWKGYITNKKGYHQEFKIEEKPPLVARDFACQSSGHSAKASLITVPETKPNEIKQVYIIHTHAPLTKAKRLEFSKNADAFVAKGYWQKIDISQWRGGSQNQKHCLTMSNLVHINEINKTFGAEKWKSITKLFQEKNKEYCAIALYDAVGITKKLNENRNRIAFSNVNQFLQKKEGNFTNNHRLQTMMLVENMQNMIVDNHISVKSKQVIDRNTDISNHSALDMRKNSALEAAKKANDKVRIAQLEREISEINKNRAANERNELNNIASAGMIKGEKAWNKYQKQLDMDALRDFKNKLNKLSQTSFNSATQYFEDHYKWITSNNLLNNIYYFDKSETLTQSKLRSGELKDSNGYLFHAIIYDLMYGITFISKGQDLINQWMNSKKVENSNLYLRAYCYNNTKLMDNYNKIFESTSSTDTYLEWGKETFLAFVEADKAFDSWLESTEAKKFILSREFKAPDKFFYWISIGLNNAFKTYSDIGKKTISVHSIKLTSVEAKKTHITNLLYLKSGDYAQHINRTEIMHQLDFRNRVKAAFPARKDGKWANYRNTKIVDIENKIQLSIRGKSNAGKNRILAVVAMFEALSFYYQYGAWKEDVKGEAELAVQLTGSFFTVIGASLELIGENMSKTSIAGNATRLAGGSFATLGSVVGLFIDIKNLNESNSAVISFILLIRVIINSALLVGQAALLFSAILSKTGGRFAVQLSEKIAINATVVFLTSARVIAGGVLVHVGLLALESFVKAYCLDDEMEDWCQKSAFHKVGSKESAYKNLDEEFEGFAKAIVSI